jgi:hypothetical protein
LTSESKTFLSEIEGKNTWNYVLLIGLPRHIRK